MIQNENRFYRNQHLRFFYTNQKQNTIIF